MAEAVLKLENVEKSYRLSDGSTVNVLNGVSFELKRGEFLCVLGPNGCGKSTLAKIVMGMETPDSGRVLVESGGKFVPMDDENRKRIGYVPQTDMLIPWKTIFENLRFACSLRGKRLEKSELEELFEKLDMKGFLDAYPFQLSVGMRQKINVIRAFLLAGDILLMDEPFSSSDFTTKLLFNRFVKLLTTKLTDLSGPAGDKIEFVSKALREVNEFLGKEPPSVLYITHDIEEAISLADRIVILTKRPAEVKDVLELGFEERDPVKRKESKRFPEEFAKVWRAFQGVFEENAS